MKQFSHLLLVSSVCLITACTATSEPDLNSSSSLSSAPSASPVAQTLPLTLSKTPQGITLNKIMSDPDWLGRQPENARWHPFADTVMYSRKREGSPVRDVWFGASSDNVNGAQLPLEEHFLAEITDRMVSYDKRWTAWLYRGYVFAHDAQTGLVKQLTTYKDGVSVIRFMQDNRISFVLDNAMYAVDPDTLQQVHLFTWHFAHPPQAVQAAPDYIAQEQIKLIDYISNKRKDRQAQADYKKRIQSAQPRVYAPEFYFAPGHGLSAVSVSPNGEWAVVATREQQSMREETDIMPHYIQEDGRIASKPVRQRVADAKPQNDELYLLNLTDGTHHALSYQTLPGYNHDILASVKTENAARKNETYEVNRLPRDITLFSSWYWRESPIYWHSKANEVGIMLEAWDNKDRWIVTVDFAEKELVTQHRLSDEAWINYAFNRFGWLHDEVALYYLSEEDGYSHLYVKPIDGGARQLTKGQYEVDQITLSPDGQDIFYKANKKHPGIYEIYKVPVAGGASTTLTDLNGMTDYALSPSGEQLLLTHSSMTRPPELFVTSANEKTAAQAVTNTISEEYLAMDFMAPSIVEVPSSHVDRPIYSRLYMADDALAGEPKRAVIFNHGAGYLQNSHLGWSGYFREYMFHNFLVEQGYVVLDMDYRASKGYGRDWRTAIYRQMGTPEVQDLRDGVNWLVANVNVDRERIGTYGGSYGGFMTFMALFTAPDLFQAGAALRPVSDWAHYNTPYTSNILNHPDIDPIAYERSSPIYFAEGLQKPLLINAPMVDDNVFFVDVVRLVQRLIELEKEDFETAIYPVEPHGFVQPSSWLDEYRRIFKLFEQNL